MNFGNHIIKKGTSLNDALFQLNKIVGEKILFIVDDKSTYIGSITDGDIRRGLIKNGSLDQKIESFHQEKSKFLSENNFDLNQLIELRENGYKVIPILDREKRIIDILNFNFYRAYLPIDAIIMAGGRGSRLSPLTDKIPKPLLKVGDKPIMEHNIDRLISYGIKDFWVSVNHLKEQIIDHFTESKNEISIRYIEEDQPMGTIGALSKVQAFQNKHVLVTNSDLLTDLNYEDFYLDFLKNDADISMVTIPYEVVIPYGVVEQDQNQVQGIKEKPTYTYYSNAGIYLMKRKVIASIPKNTFFNATDLIMYELSKKKKVISYPFSGYWIDIGKPEDFKRANSDFKYIKF
jgi:dTDP-glucose pyrophosphorylase